MKCRRWVRLPRAGAVACALLAVAGCGHEPQVLAPGRPVDATVRSACARPGGAWGAGQVEAAYQVQGMFARGITGAGTVIAVIMPATAPRVAADVAVYSRRYGLPAPRVRELAYGHGPPSAGREAAGWEEEGTVDLEMAHALAPGAALVYLAVPAGAGATGVGLQYDAALAWLVTHYRIDVVSYSAGIPEAWDQSGGYRAITASRRGLEAAARAGTTVVAAAGDFGPTAPQPDGTLYPGAVVAWPASDPLATAVGGTRLTTTAGHIVTTADAYADVLSGGRSGGAGLSAVFPRPPWQDGVAAVTGPHRGIADVSMDASPCSPVAAYTSVNVLPGRKPGWITLAGTSVATPLFAGIVADAAQIAGHPLGVLGPALYKMHGSAEGITDITAGTDSMPGHPGYQAHSGYDLPTGIGTVGNALLFTTSLARLAKSPAGA